jgi:enoyl-CoA hydratase
MDYQTILFELKDRIATITFNRPDRLNAINEAMREDFSRLFDEIQTNEAIGVIVFTGAGRAFSAGGDIDHIAGNAANPGLFDVDARIAKRIVFTVLDLEKPLVCRLNGHAVGLGATLALLSDVIFAADNAKIGDPHVGVGLVAGDGGAVIWPQRIGLTLAKEFLLTGDLLTAQRAAEIGLINHCLPAAELDGAVDAFCQRLLKGATTAIRSTKILLNLELKRIAHAVLDAGIAYEALSVRTAHHREAVEALQEKRAPTFSHAKD